MLSRLMTYQVRSTVMMRVMMKMATMLVVGLNTSVQVTDVVPPPQGVPLANPIFEGPTVSKAQGIVREGSAGGGGTTVGLGRAVWGVAPLDSKSR